MKTNTTFTFTEEEYKAFNKVSMMLDDLINGEYHTAFTAIMDKYEIDSDLLYDWFATITNYVEDHRE